MKFLIPHSANLDKTDCNRYYHTPLEHCISLNLREHRHYPFELFLILLNAGADYNKGSIDDTRQRDLCISEKTKEIRH